MNSTGNRINVVDALRGFAIVSIMLLHNVEHFDFLYWPEGLPAWLVSLDKGVMNTLYFLFGGKSYAIFALLFGLTFYIQSNNQAKIGKDFRARFAWRLVILMMFAFVNSAFYEGDILSIYAVLGFFLIPVAKLSTPVVFWIALILMAQPVEWINFFVGLQNPGLPVSDPKSWAYFGKAGEYITQNSLIDTLIGNLTNGKKAVILWTWEQGRVFQNIALFLLGMLAGREKIFVPSDKSQRFWKWTLPVASLLFLLLFFVQGQLRHWVDSKAALRPLETIIKSYANMAFMMVLVSSFVLLFKTKAMHRFLNAFSPMGKMSLSNYLLQSLVGAVLYYGFGFGLYLYTGATYCLLIGIVLALLQWLFSRWWMARHKQGPLEAIWHKLTWLGAEK